MPARSEGARGRARAGAQEEGGREAPGARARAGRCWAAAAVTMAESAGASSFFPLVVLLLAGSGGSGPRGIQGESRAGRGRRGMPRAKRGLAPAVGLGRAPSPAAQYGRAGGAEGRGGWRWVSPGDPRALPGGARPVRPGGRASSTLSSLCSEPRLPRDVEVPGSCPSARPCEGVYSLPADAPGGAFSPAKIVGFGDGSLFLRGVLIPRAHSYPGLQTIGVSNLPFSLQYPYPLSPATLTF